MPREKPIEIFMPPNMLKVKLRGGLPALDKAAIARAEAAIAELKDEFSAWLDEDVRVLAGAFETFSASPGEKAAADLYRAAHDLKGQAATYSFPSIGRVAGSLCTLFEAITPERAPGKLVAAHIDTIRAMVRDGIRDEASPTARALVGELARQVGETVAAVQRSDESGSATSP